MSDLRKAVIRLAHAKPELRPELLPLLKEAEQIKKASWKSVLEDFVADPSPYNKSELSDYGMNTFREAAYKQGYDRKELVNILTEERDRIRAGNLTPNLSGMRDYWRIRRTGSLYRVDRKMRVGIFLHAVAKGWVR